MRYRPIDLNNLRKQISLTHPFPFLCALVPDLQRDSGKDRWQGCNLAMNEKSGFDETPRRSAVW